jgi:1-phosphofructokinase family hexose kinase
MLLVVCPNLAIDRILQVDHFQAGQVQRSRQVLTQPGGKGSNAARVYRQLGGDVILAGFVGRNNGQYITEPLRRLGIHVDAVAAYEESRTCTIICDSKSGFHPTVVNEESPHVDSAAARRLLRTIERWIPDIDGILTTGSLSTGLAPDFYAAILDYARLRGKLTAIDATGAALRSALAVRPTFMKPNTEEMRQLLSGASISVLADHTAFTFGKTGALLLAEGQCLYASPPRTYDTNPIGAGDAFAAGYLKSLLQHRSATECLRVAMSAAASDTRTLRPGFIDPAEVDSLTGKVELRFTPGVSPSN